MSETQYGRRAATMADRDIESNFSGDESDNEHPVRYSKRTNRHEKFVPSSGCEDKNHFTVPHVESRLPLDINYDEMFVGENGQNMPNSVGSVDMSSYWYLSAFVLGMMSTFAGVCGKGTAASVLGGLSGAASTATKDMGSYSYDRAKELRSIKMAQDLWQRDTIMDTKLHLISINSELFQNEEQLLNDLRITSKESQRDMYDASNQKLQTLILASTVMFVALSTVMIQGNLGSQPILQPQTVYTRMSIQFMSVFGALSFLCLFFSIIMCIELLNRSARFMMTMSDYQQLKIDDFNQDKAAYSLQEKDFVVGSTGKEVEEKFNRHEKDISQTMKSIRDHRKDIFEHPDKKAFFQKSFSQFWTSIEKELYFADLFFYSGTWFMLLATALFLFQHFDNFGSNLVGVIIIPFSLAVMVVYVLTVRAPECREVSRSPFVRLFQRIRGFLRKYWIYFQRWAFGWKADHKGTLKRLLQNTYDYVGLRLIKKLRESADQFLDFERYLHDLHEYDLANMSEALGFEIQDSEGNDITELSEYYIIIMLMLDEVNKVLKFFDLKHDVDDAYYGMYDFKRWYLDKSLEINDREEREVKEKEILDMFKYDDMQKSRERLKEFWEKFIESNQPNKPRQSNHFRICMSKLASAACKNPEERSRSTQTDQNVDKKNSTEKFEYEDRENRFFKEFNDYMKLPKSEKKEEVLRIMYYDSKTKKFEKDKTSRTIRANKSSSSYRSSADPLRRQGSNDSSRPFVEPPLRRHSSNGSSSSSAV